MPSNRENMKKYNPKKYKHLNDHHWGVGIENEMQIFHQPCSKECKVEPITEYIMFDPKPIIDELIENNKLDRSDLDFIKTIPFEVTGRKCNGKVVLEKTPVAMPEFITDRPFNTINNKRSIEDYCGKIIDNKLRFFRILHQHEQVEKLNDKYGFLTEYPYNVCNYFKFPIRTIGSNYIFSKDKNGNDKLYYDYLGSYHLTLTLPYVPHKTTRKEFIQMHQNFANMIQWIEPLLITAFFSCDQSCVGSGQKPIEPIGIIEDGHYKIGKSNPKRRIKGSFRVARIGWGNFGGSDVRKFDKGIGRYANILPYWREGLDFYEADKTNLCEELAPDLKLKEPSAISGFSSNFRTFGSTDPQRPMHRESGIGMTIPNGIEIRIFDHFDNGFLTFLFRFIIQLAENSRIHQSSNYVYKNKHWIHVMQTITLNGWKTLVSEEYIDCLRNELGLKILTKSRVAYFVLLEINEELFKKTVDGDWSYLYLAGKYTMSPYLPDLNRGSWQMSFMLKANREPEVIKMFDKLLATFVKDAHKRKSNFFDIDDAIKIFFKCFNKDKWENDVIDMLYFLEYLEIVKIKINPIGTIKQIIFEETFLNLFEDGKYVPPATNFNREILAETIQFRGDNTRKIIHIKNTHLE